MNYKCKVEGALKILGNKWTFLIIKELMKETKRFKELHYVLTGVSPKTLTERLRTLEGAGIIERKVYPVIPPKVEYSLTEKGRDLKPVIDNLKEWGEKYL